MSSGPDQVYVFWIKHIICFHSNLTRSYNFLVQNPDTVRSWLSEEINTLIAKNDRNDQDKN